MDEMDNGLLEGGTVPLKSCRSDCRTHTPFAPAQQRESALDMGSLPIVGVRIQQTTVKEQRTT
jgi:hypothetical protein